MKVKNKILKYLTLAGATLAVSIPTVVTLASCSNTQKEFTVATPNDVFANSVTQLGAAFTDSPSTTEFQSVYGGLVTYVTEGDYVYDGDKLVSRPQSRLVLEGASKIVIYGKDSGNTTDTTEKVLHTIDSANLSDTNAFVKNANGSYSINIESFGQKMTTATKVEFTLNKDFKWVDTQGQPKQSLVPKDFLDSLKGYKQSSDYGLNANGYFLGLAGIDYQKTIDYADNNSTEAGTSFTYFIKDNAQTPYFLDILTKQYFFPIPYSHPDTAGTLETPDNAKVLKFIKKGDKNIIDRTGSNWSAVYGGAQETGIDVWSIGPYYLSSKSQQDVVFSISQFYFDAMKATQDMNKLDITKKIPKVIKRYNAGDTTSIYDKFGTGEVSFASVPQQKNAEAISRYSSSPSLIQMPAPKTSQGRYIGYNMSIFDENGNLKNSSLVTTGFETFIKKFHTKDALTVRKGLNTYINWAKLAEVRYTQGSKDFSLSTIPYGVYPVTGGDNGTSIDYYEAIGNEKELTVEKVDVNPSTTEKVVPKGIIDGKYKKMYSSDQDILATNEEKTAFKQALTNLGFSDKNSLVLSYWTLLQTKDVKDKNYFESVAKAIGDLSDGVIQFTFTDFNTNTVEYVYTNKSVPMGDMLWGPDYNGLGTWVGMYFEYDFGADGNPVDSKKVTTTSTSTTTENGYDTLLPAYHLTNLWMPLYNDLLSKVDSNNTGGPTTTATTTPVPSWAKSLRDYLSSKKAAEFGQGKTYKNIKSNLSNEISIWAGQKESNGINLVNWMDSQFPILPLYQPSLTYIGYKLVDPNYTVIMNLNGDISYRDFVKNN